MVQESGCFLSLLSLFLLSIHISSSLSAAVKVHARYQSSKVTPTGAHSTRLYRALCMINSPPPSPSRSSVSLCLTLSSSLSLPLSPTLYHFNAGGGGRLVSDRTQSQIKRVHTSTFQCSQTVFHLTLSIFLSFLLSLSLSIMSIAFLSSRTKTI